MAQVSGFRIVGGFRVRTAWLKLVVSNSQDIFGMYPHHQPVILHHQYQYYATIIVVIIILALSVLATLTLGDFTTRNIPVSECIHSGLYLVHPKSAISCCIGFRLKFTYPPHHKEATRPPLRLEFISYFGGKLSSLSTAF